MALADRLDGYEVTVLPAPGAAGLRLVWHAPDTADPSPVTPDHDDGDGPSAVLVLLDAYRITRVPARVAS